MMTTTNSCKIAVLIPSYDRPKILETALKSWLRLTIFDKVFLVIQGSSNDVLKQYSDMIKKFDHRIKYVIINKPVGSIKARNILLEMASQSDCEYIIMADDDTLLPKEVQFERVIDVFNSNNTFGIVGGRVVNIRKQKLDPDFFLNLPLNLADILSKLTGYVFIDIKHGPRYAEFVPHFFMIKKEIINRGIRYDELLNVPTCFREESDFELQVKNHGYKIYYYPRMYVIHLATEYGGNRSLHNMKERAYWKSRNHTIFILKHNKSWVKRLWYLTFSTIFLSLYRISYVIWILAGIREGIKNYYTYNCSLMK
ncbi:MAG: glycosyltransferase [Nitrososphaeria archaeon]